MHTAIAAGLNEAEDIEARCATLHQPEHGLTEKVLEETDVLFWWGHVAHDKVSDEIAERAQKRALEGMGLVALHSGHMSKVFRRLMGTNCSLRWREVDERQRLWVCNPGHRIVQGLGECIEIPKSEMYGEPFMIPPPHEQIFISWFEGGEVFRSGCTWLRGNGKIFYFSPGHETLPIYYQEEIKLVLKNAARWARQEHLWKGADHCPQIPLEKTREKIGRK
ncbi:MAG: trehalose utilization protein ThuA [Armatimonadetes bacterium]|nr:trehalose utilization protein ThuA [Armatimonadota bacterium]NIM23848.1 trehalose utilization protein ThuA [Armatimonadota bacterium]NIM67727.1 trehalose utilization protein ThuA [Armatimonadota bacterium]NIM76236.1 trehalose utilization protein ThuA [Armatimonadota bacterium]NIN05929.1 trehalose utilization protein ThuA [Armatimonadota bacterium]